MRRRRSTTVALSLALSLFAGGAVTGCAGKIKSGTKFDESANFAQYDTYAWITDDLVLLRSGTGNARIRNVENEKKIRTAIDRRLHEAGLEKVDRESASLVVTFNVGTRERLDIGGIESSAYATVWSASDADGTYTEGTLQVDMFDGPSQKHVWHGWASRALRPGDDPDAIIDTAVRTVLAEFPPK